MTSNHDLSTKKARNQLKQLLLKIISSKKDILSNFKKYHHKALKTYSPKLKKADIPLLLTLSESTIDGFAEAVKAFDEGKSRSYFNTIHKNILKNSSTISFEIYLKVIQGLKQVVLEALSNWFGSEKKSNMITIFLQFIEMLLIETIRGYIKQTDTIIHEKDMESSLLFHTTQSVAIDLNLDSLMNKVVFHASMLLRNKHVYLMLVDRSDNGPKENEGLVLKASNQIGETYGEFRLARGEGPVGKILITKEAFVDNDYNQAKKKLPFIHDAQCVMAVPIIFSDELLGILITTEKRRTNKFGTTEKDLFAMYAKQIAIVFKNVLLFHTQEKNSMELSEKNLMLESQSDLVLRKTAQMVILNEVSQQVNSTLDLDDVLKVLTRQSAESIGVNRCLVWLFDDKKIKLEAKADYGLKNDELTNLELHLSDIRDTAFFKCVTTFNPVLIEDSLSKEIVQNKIADCLEIKSMLVVPLIFKDEAIGLLTVDDTREPHEFLEDEITLISSITNQTVMAIENARLYQKVKEQAITDGMTGLYNHRFFQLRLTDEFNNASRYGNPLSLIMMDIDFFKKYNDTYGHVAGDLALKEIATLTQASVRENDIVARYGGEEFVIILPMTTLEGTVIVGERVRAAISKCRFLGNVNMPQVSMSVSIGIASFNEKTSGSRELLIKQADAALYAAKEGGRNRVVVFSPELKEHISHKQ